ncbi:hypothetical protein [Sphingobacterium yanglingense]|uniref:Uncharacterized protein n=1 Tax=Sphingobacterium yanglingense TaxID=1437280 RepID=A0A4R6WLM5_9SPHI|nr:hypothetical protein [Sphingobacterium yanglingense]TDQ81724.1 hypothetical protein CLV99_0254 [Sphingobacterium yanglingense]
MRAFIILPLAVFSIIGFVLLFFAITLHWEVGVAGWITISLFAFFPLLILYGVLFGFSLSGRQHKIIEERKNKLSADGNGICIDMPLFDKRCAISWESIEAIVHYNYIVSSDFTTVHRGFRFYLNSLPTYTKYDRQWWLNRLFSKDPQDNCIDITDETKGYQEIPVLIEKYLGVTVTIDCLKDPRKGSHISTEMQQYKDKVTTIEKWKPESGDRETIVYSRSGQSIEELEKAFS